MAPASEIDWWRWNWIDDYGVSEFERRGSRRLLELICGYRDDSFLHALTARSEQQPAEAAAMTVLRTALLENRTIVSRFGFPAVVPITTQALDRRDLTGVSQVRFPAGSTQAVEWQGLTQDETPGKIIDTWYLQSLFVGTSIQIDASEFPTNRPPELDVVPNHLNSFVDQIPSPRAFSTPHRRCDLLGLLLYQHRWTCEQRGNVLILHPGKSTNGIFETDISPFE